VLGQVYGYTRTKRKQAVPAGIYKLTQFILGLDLPKGIEEAMKKVGKRVVRKVGELLEEATRECQGFDEQKMLDELEGAVS